MKRYHSNKTLLFLLAILFSITIACKKEKESEGLYKVTTFVKIDLVGGEIYSHMINTPYTEPGYTATDIADNNKIVTNQVIVSGSVVADEAGAYPITYTVNNSEGFTTTVVRLVVVFDNSSVSPTDFSGTYNSVISRTTTTTGAVAVRPPKPGDFYTITIKKITTGLFSIDDFLGGWYWYGSVGYGYDYAYPGLFVVKADNSIALVSADMDQGWGDGIILDPNPGEDSRYDPVSGNIYLFSYMGSVNYLKFAVTLSKQPE
jgi:hypothetical protein